MASTLTLGCSAFMARVASKPSISGMRTSISTRSGFRRQHSSTTSRPLDASPTTSRSSSYPSMCLMPSLTSSWSSAMRIRAGTWLSVSDSVSPFVVCLLLLFSVSRQGDLRHYRRSDTRFATDLEAAAEQYDPVAHAGEPHRLSWTGTSPYVTSAETPPPVSNLEPHDLLVAPDRHSQAIGFSVFAHITEGFLGQPEQVDLQRRGKALLS